MASLPKPVVQASNVFSGRTFEELIDERVVDVAALRAEVAAAGIGGYDDIALVRYLCSFGTVAHTFKAITVAQDVAREKVGVLAAASGEKMLECAGRVEPHSSFMFRTTPGGRAAFIIKASGCQYRKLMKQASYDDIVDFVLYKIRGVWLWADSVSRQIGRVVQCDIVIDLAVTDLCRGSLPPATFRNAVNRAANLSAVLHPLVQGNSVMVSNMDARDVALARRLLETLRPLLPQSIANSAIHLGSGAAQPTEDYTYIEQMFPSAADPSLTVTAGTFPVSGAVFEVKDGVKESTSDVETVATSGEDSDVGEASI